MKAANAGRAQSTPEAAGFEPNEYLEALARLKRENPGTFARSISSTAARALEIYERDRDAHEPGAATVTLDAEG